MQGVRGYAGTLAEALARQDRSFTDTENAAHKTNHAVVGALVARTWLFSPVIYQAVRLHHDFTVLDDSRIEPQVRTLVAMALAAEHLVHDFEGVTHHPEWQLHGASCLGVLQVQSDELTHWADALLPVFQSVTVG